MLVKMQKPKTGDRKGDHFIAFVPASQIGEWERNGFTVCERQPECVLPSSPDPKPTQPAGEPTT